MSRRCVSQTVATVRLRIYDYYSVLYQSSPRRPRKAETLVTDRSRRTGGSARQTRSGESRWQDPGVARATTACPVPSGAPAAQPAERCELRAARSGARRFARGGPRRSRLAGRGPGGEAQPPRQEAASSAVSPGSAHGYLQPSGSRGVPEPPAGNGWQWWQQRSGARGDRVAGLSLLAGLQEEVESLRSVGTAERDGLVEPCFALPGTETGTAPVKKQHRGDPLSPWSRKGVLPLCSAPVKARCSAGSSSAFLSTRTWTCWRPETCCEGGPLC